MCCAVCVCGLQYKLDQANGTVFELLTRFGLNNLTHPHLQRHEENVCVVRHLNPSFKTFSCTFQTTMD